MRITAALKAALEGVLTPQPAHVARAGSLNISFEARRESLSRLRAETMGAVATGNVDARTIERDEAQMSLEPENHWWVTDVSGRSP